MEALRARTIYSPELTSNGRSTPPPGPFFSLWPFPPLCAAPSWPATLPTSGALGRTHMMKKGPAHCTFQALMGSAAELRSINDDNHDPSRARSQDFLRPEYPRCPPSRGPRASTVLVGGPTRLTASTRLPIGGILSLPR